MDQILTSEMEKSPRFRFCLKSGSSSVCPALGLGDFWAGWDGVNSPFLYAQEKMLSVDNLGYVLDSGQIAWVFKTDQPAIYDYGFAVRMQGTVGSASSEVTVKAIKFTVYGEDIFLDPISGEKIIMEKPKVLDPKPFEDIELEARDLLCQTNLKLQSMDIDSNNPSSQVIQLANLRTQLYTLLDLLKNTRRENIDLCLLGYQLNEVQRVISRTE